MTTPPLPTDSELPRATGLSATLAGRLAALIHAGDLGPGDRLPTEKQLVERFAVSRAVVREAIARLKTDGFVESRQGSGAFVAAKPGLANFRIVAQSKGTGQLDTADLAHVFELRGVIEVGMAELAAQRRTKADIAALDAAFMQMQQALEQGGDGADADDAFHAAIATAAHNPYLAQFAAFLAQHFSATRRLTWQPEARQSGSTLAAQAEHLDLVKAILQGNAEAAGFAARRHIAGAAARYQAAQPAQKKKG
ncbi:FadR family transcriptional regulator [Ferrovibrio terrae]|uniref:FadR family transcriptional regulator n=1 Tax=Ferrovibrio terrae TaxID=2594003 RepID=A0A516GWG1_9PROT|nr:FadR/GntR family transcriptional regulator [Ferrovibrio terrae]QDO95846.1 FadR family transcriptional regulator [Ferrovibrio terrae]